MSNAKRNTILLIAMAAVLAVGTYGLMTRQRSNAVPAAGTAPASTERFNPDFVKTVLPVRQMARDEIPVTGKLALDKQQLRIASARVAGRLGRIFVFEGQSVSAGQPLAEIYSPEFISAQQEFLLAQRFRHTLTAGVVDAELAADADATYQSATSKLKTLGASDEDIAQLTARGTVQQYLNVRAPISGVITQRNVDPGGYLNIGDSLMTVANTDRLWLYFNSYDSDYAALKLGQELQFQSSALPDRSFSGHVSFIAPSIDPTTHTLPVRCDIPNADHALRPEMFVKGSLIIGEREAWVVPKTAVIHIRDTDYVIVEDGDQRYRRVAVQGHPLPPDRYAIVGGLDAAVPVVSDGGLLVNEHAGEG